MFNYISIYKYYELQHNMKLAGYSLGEINEMLPFEVDIQAALHEKYLDEVEKARKRNQK